MLAKILYHAVGRPIRKALFLNIQLQVLMQRFTRRVYHVYCKLLLILHDGP